MPENTIHLAVLISGNGSNLQSIIDHINNGKLNAKIKCVISNIPNVKGLQRAKKYHIPSHLIDHEKFNSRPEFECAVANVIRSYDVDLIILAGFMRVLTSDFITRFKNKIINIHPSLLPKHKGLNTHAQVLEAGDTQHGCTVHLVTAQLDSGKIIMQRSFQVGKADTVPSLTQKTQKIEHIIYPLAIKKYVQAQLDPSNL